jgi:hypothetical protein
LRRFRGARRAEGMAAGAAHPRHAVCNLRAGKTNLRARKQEDTVIALLAPRRPSRLACLGLAVACTLGLASGLAGQAAANTGPAPKRVAIVPQPTDGGALRVEVGQPVMLSARAQRGDGALLPLEGRVPWNSSNPTVVQVTNLGDARSPAIVTPLKPGIASVTITYPAIPAVGAQSFGPMEGIVGDVVTLVVEDRS